MAAHESDCWSATLGVWSAASPGAGAGRCSSRWGRRSSRRALGLGGRVLRDRRTSTARAHLAEVIGFRGSNVLSMPVETTEGIRFGDPVAALGVHPEIEVGPALMGRVLNALGSRSMRFRPPAVSQTLPLEGAVRSPLDRCRFASPLGTGIRVIDALLTVGRGQRVGIFGGSGWARAR
jgi:flagellar biosynthesis/type III secretory pathway ATPase